MLRAIRIIVIIAPLVALAVWLANNPGQVSLEWLGYHIETSFGIFLLGVLALGLVLGLLYRVWSGFRSVPGRLRGRRAESRRHRGYEALTRGMVALAVGDAQEARRLAAQAESLLQEPPLTMLLHAQASQLAGDDDAATRYYEAMSRTPGMEFLGLRGLINQAAKRGDREAALPLAQQAYRLQPKIDWLAENLFDLELRSGKLEEAEGTLRERIRHGQVDRATGERQLAVIEHLRSVAAEASGQEGDALKLARKAAATSPGFVPAQLRLAALFQARGKLRKAAHALEQGWTHQPHPDLAEAYRALFPHEDPLQTARNVQHLVSHRADHNESHLCAAEALLRARLWGEARRHLDAALTQSKTSRALRLMAELEEAEHGDGAKVRDLLRRATVAEPDQAWVCGSCGTVIAGWEAFCPNCDAFDSFTWRTPSHTAPTSLHPEPEERQRLAEAVEHEAVDVEAEVVSEPSAGETPAEGPGRAESGQGEGQGEAKRSEGTAA